MDWLNEITEKLKLKTSFFIYMVLYIFIGLFIAAAFLFGVRYFVELGRINSVNDNLYLDNLFMERNIFIDMLAKLVKNYNSIIYIAFIVVFAIIGFKKFYKDKLESFILDLNELSENTNKSQEKISELDELYDNLSNFIDEQNINKIKLINEKNDFDKKITDFGHDIKNPLAIVKGNVEIMEMIDKDDESFSKLIDSTNKNILRIENYIQRLESLRKFENIEIKNNNIILQDFIEILIMDYNIVNLHKKIIWNYPKEKIICNFDDILFSEVIHNLINNAIRFAKEKIVVNFKIQDYNLLIEVIDDGEGFSKEALINGKSQFFTENPGKGNMGLGLNISSSILSYYNSDLILENTKNGGKVSFKIKLENN